MIRQRYQKNSRSVRANRADELRSQEQLLLQRKREIEEKLKASNAESSSNSNPAKDDVSEAKNDDIPKEIIEVPNEKLTESNDAKTADDTDKANVFANDGSFMEKFRRLQEQMSKGGKKEEPREVAIEEKSPECEPKPLPKIAVKLSLEPVTQCRLQVCEDKPTVFLEDRDGPVSPPEETAVRLAIEKSAISVAMNGNDMEQQLKLQNKNDPYYSWLFEDKGMYYKYYLKRLNELKNAKERANQVDNTDKDQPTKKRKSRWGEAKSVTPSSVPGDQPLLQYALKVFGSLDLTTDQWKQLEDQRKMSVLVEMMKAKEREKVRLEQQGKVKYEYDSDEETEGGTWEHKRRQEEMEKTQNWAVDLTSRGHGGHHIGDFLPPDELEKFMQKWEAIKDGKAASIEYSDYQKFKLTSHNVGFQMLQKMGWAEGQGLGASSSGIDKPIDMNSAGPANAGLGTDKPDSLKTGDDEFEAYRKRMMVAYRFRPNPLNNPRRTYY